MLVKVVATAAQAEQSDFTHQTVVVIDVLRATSVITTALMNGARAVLSVRTPDEAISLSKTMNPEQFLLGGEKDAVKIEGFHLGNSPFEYPKEIVDDKDIILCTSNGTRAIHAAKQADELYVLSFLNLKAVAELLSENTGKLSIVCSGTQNRFSMDDGLCAAMLLQLLQKKHKLTTDDLAQTLLAFAEAKTGNIRQKLASCYHLNYLIDKGFETDVTYCLQTNISAIVPRRRGDFIVSH